METSIARSIMQRGFTSRWIPRLVDSVAVCGLGTEKFRVDGEGRFHTLATRSPFDPIPRPFAPQLLDRFPAEDDQFELPRMLPAVVLPYGVQVYSEGPNASVPESAPRVYPVILTDVKGVKIYVAVLRFRDKVDPFLVRHHRLPAGSWADKCVCIVSRVPCLDTFQGFLVEIHRLCFHEESRPRAVWDIIQDMTRVPLPEDIDTVHSFSIHKETYKLSLPEEISPHLPHVSYRTLVECLDIDNILTLFAALLAERKIILKGSSVALLSHTAEALVSLLYPLKWMSVYVPVLPIDALECLDAPVTYIYGVCSADVDIHIEDLDKVVLADLDRNTVKMIYAGGREPREDEALDFKEYGIPKLPHRAADRLRRSLCYLTRPNSSTLMTVPHFRPRQETEDLDLQVALSDQKWGPRHDERFQLAFVRFMAELLRGYQDFIMRPGSEDTVWSMGGVNELFRGVEFLLDRLEELGEDGEALLHLLFDSTAWSAFLTEESTEEESPRTLVFKEIMASLDSDEGASLDLLSLLEYQNRTVVHLDHGLFRSQGSGADNGDGDGVSGVHQSFPESEASVLAEKRRKEEEESLLKVDGKRAQAEKMKATLRQKSQNKISLHLKNLQSNPLDPETVAQIKATFENDQGEAVLGDCISSYFHQRMVGRERVELQHDFFHACKDLFISALQNIERTKDYQSAAVLLEVSGRMVLETPGGEATEPVSLRRELKGLKLWEDKKLWQHIFNLRVDSGEESESQASNDPGAKMEAMTELVKTMGDVGLPLTTVGALLEHLCSLLCIKSQILLHNQFPQLQLLVHTPARLFAETLSQGRARRAMPTSKSGQRWMAAVSKVKSRETLASFPTA